MTDLQPIHPGFRWLFAADDVPHPVVATNCGGEFWMECSGCGERLCDIEEGNSAAWLADMGNHTCRS